MICTCGLYTFLLLAALSAPWWFDDDDVYKGLVIGGDIVRGSGIGKLYREFAEIGDVAEAGKLLSRGTCCDKAYRSSMPCIDIFA